jgi:glycosyltransferase involved in cell wall biosynthesis
MSGIISIEELKKRIEDSYEISNDVVEKVPDPQVTARVVTYNHASFIRDCLEGILMQQTTFPFEIVVGEDCSTDGTREIVMNYAKEYPDKMRVITSDYNVGMRANGKRCYLASRGKYVALCDGDDHWTDPLKLQKQYDFMEAHSEYAMCYHAYRLQTDGKISKKLYPLKGRDFSGDELVATPEGIATSTKFLRHVLRMDRESFLSMPSGDYFINAFVGTFGACKFLPDIKPSIRTIHAGGVWSCLHAKTRLYGAINTKIYIYKYFQEKNDDRRAILALSALQDMIQEIFPKIDPKRKQLIWNASRLRIIFKGIHAELYYKPLIQKFVRTIVRVFR